MLQVGFRTWYSGADQRYIEKCKLKDASTTQAALGFKICGMQVGMSRSTAVGGPAGWDIDACVCSAGVQLLMLEFAALGPKMCSMRLGRPRCVCDLTSCRLGHCLNSAFLSVLSHAAQELAASGFMICTYPEDRPPV